MRIPCAVLVLILLPLGLHALGPQELVQVNFYNETGKSIKYIFASPSSSDFWGPDLLGNRRLDFGKTLDFLMHFQNATTYFDFMAVDEFNDVYLLPGRAFYDNGKQVLLTFGIKDRKGQLPPRQLCRVYITNASTRVFSLVFMASVDSEDWGFDLLSDSSSLMPGASISFSVPCGKKPTVFDLYAMAEDASFCRKHVAVSLENPEMFIDLMNADLH